MASPIITLTTDMGNSDFYVAALKGSIYTELETARVVDISNSVRPFDVTHAAFLLRNAYHHFPQGTVHIIGVNPELTATNSQVVVKNNGHYFVGADNGIFSLLFDTVPDLVYELKLEQRTDALTFPTKNLFVTAACHVARGGSLDLIGNRIEDFKNTNTLKAAISANQIKGAIIHIDVYNNAITNIDRTIFKEIGKGRDFFIEYRPRKDEIRKISQVYNDVSAGSQLALFNSCGLLEIAINKGTLTSGGGAASLLGIKLNGMVCINFNDGYKNS